MAKPWRALNASWLDTSERLGSAGRQLADNLLSLDALIRDPDLLSSLSSITGLYDHLIVAQTQQIHLLLVLVADLVHATLSSLIDDLRRLLDRHHHNISAQVALQSLLSLYTMEHVRLSVSMDELQHAVRVDRNWARASIFADKLQSSLRESHEFKQLILQLSMVIP